MDKTLAFQNVDTLRAIKAAGADATIAGLARALERDPSNMRKTLALLAENGLIEREPAIVVTAQGEAILAADDVAEGRAVPGDTLAADGQLPLRHAQILPDPENARRDWDSEDAVADLQALAADIVQHGLLQNLVVRGPTTDDHIQSADGRPATLYTLVGGERRWRAIGRLIASGDWPADQAIPCRLLDADDVGVRLAALAENLQRRNLNPIEEAAAYRGLREVGLTTEQIADRVAMTQRHVQMRLQLLDLTEDQQRLMTLPADDPDRLSISEARRLVQNLEAKRKLRDQAETDFTARQRLIFAEMRLAARNGYIYDRVEVDGEAAVADEDAVALDKAGLITLPTGRSYDGKTFVRCDTKAHAIGEALFPEGAAVYAAALRDSLGLPRPGEGRHSTPWLNGPFEAPPEVQAEIDAARKADEERQAKWKADREQAEQDRKARAERWALTRVHAEGLLAKAAEAPAAALLDDVPLIAGQLEHPLPWRATDEATLLDANGEEVLTCSVGWGAVTDAEVSVAMMTAVAVNTAAGLETPPLRVEADEDAEAGDEPGEETDPSDEAD